MNRLNRALERWNLRFTQIRQRLLGTWSSLDARSGGWLGLGKRAFERFAEHQGNLTAAAIAYYTLLSILPLALGLVSLGSLVLDSSEAQEAVLELVARYSPAIVGLVEQTIQQVLQARGAFGLIAVLGFLWSSVGVFGALSRAVNTAWEVERPRSAWKEQALALGMVVSVVLLFFLSVLSTALFEVRGRLPGILLGEEMASGDLSSRLAAAIVPYIFTALLFWVLYRVLPHAKVAWSDVLPAALLASLVWEVAKHGFAFYAAEFALYSLVYGSLAVVVVFLVWSYLSGMIILLGAEFSVQYARRRWKRQRR
jgi:membrane protein